VGFKEVEIEELGIEIETFFLSLNIPSAIPGLVHSQL